MKINAMKEKRFGLILITHLIQDSDIIEVLPMDIKECFTNQLVEFVIKCFILFTQKILQSIVQWIVTPKHEAKVMFVKVVKKYSLQNYLQSKCFVL